MSIGISKSDSNRVVLGIEDIDRRLDALAKREAAKVVRAGITAGLAILTPEIRNQTLADTTFAQSQRSKARGHRSVAVALAATVAGKFKVGKAGQDVTAKSGFVSGKKSKGEASREAASVINKGGKRDGKGLTARNAHWFALGTPKLTQVKAVSRAGGKLGQVAAAIDKAARSKLEEVTAALAKS